MGISGGGGGGRDVLHVYGWPVPRSRAYGFPRDAVGVEECLHGFGVGDPEIVAEAREEDAVVVTDEAAEGFADVRRRRLLLVLAVAGGALLPPRGCLLPADGEEDTGHDVRGLREDDHDRPHGAEEDQGQDDLRGALAHPLGSPRLPPSGVLRGLRVQALIGAHPHIPVNPMPARFTPDPSGIAATPATLPDRATRIPARQPSMIFDLDCFGPHFSRPTRTTVSRNTIT